MHDAGRARPATYAVVWNEAGASPAAGRLELGPLGLVLDGSAGAVREARRVVGYDELVGVRVERRGRPGLETRPALVLDCRDGTRVEVTPVSGAGVLHELTDRLGAARGAARR